MMLQIPMSKKAIAEAIGVDKSTVYREIKRNCDARSGSYSMELAQRKADRRKQQKHRKEVLTPAMRKRIIKLLKKGFSPEQIVGRSRLEGIAMVSHETIYRWIWEDKRRGGKLHKYLRRQGRRYAKRGSKNAGRGFIPGRVDIDERPEIVELKERFGDLEIDTIIGKNHKGAILTINDRATSRVWIRKLSGKEAIPVAKIAVWALRKVKNLIQLNSTCKCNRILINNLFKFFVWREVSKSFTRSIIEFIFNPLNLFVGYFTKVLTLWDILPDKPVGVFIGTTFP